MYTSSDLELLKSKGISTEKLTEQLQSFVTGFPYLKIICAASPQKGIKVMNNDEIIQLLDTWDNYLKKNASIMKFVPASGAASRMFKIYLNSWMQNMQLLKNLPKLSLLTESKILHFTIR